MLAIGKVKWLVVLFVVTLMFVVMVSAVTALSHTSLSGPFIQILEPEDGDDLSGKTTIRIGVEGGKGQMIAIYFDMVGLSHDMIMEDSYYKTVEVDTSKHYDGEHLINVHVHPPSGNAFHVGKLKVTTYNGNPAPNGDWLLPDLEFLDHIYKTDANLLHTRVRLKDDGPIEGAQVLSHINRAIGRPAAGPPLEPEDTVRREKQFHSIYRVHLLPFQTNQPQETTIWFFIADAVGRANLVDSKVLIPANTTEQQIVPLPKAEIVNMEMFQDFLPEKVHVKLENSHMATDLVLWVGDKVINRFPLNGTETEVEIPVNVNKLSDFFEAKIGESARATAVWIEFRPKISEFPELAKVSGLLEDLSIPVKSLSIPVLGHKHINPIDLSHPLRPLRANFNVRLSLKDQNGRWAGGGIVKPLLDDWTKVTFTIPSGLTFPLKRTDIVFRDDESLLSGPIYIDEITIGSNRTYSFEEGSVASWTITRWTKKRGGISWIGISTDQAYVGTRSMEVVLSGLDSRVSVQLKAVTDITEGDVLSFYVYTPSSVPD